jgi:hypothetical protein
VSRCSSVSIVSYCGLDDQAIEVRSPAEASVSRPALGPTQHPVKWLPGVLFPRLKCGMGVMLTTHPHLVPSSRMSRSYTCCPPSAFVACSETVVVFLYRIWQLAFSWLWRWMFIFWVITSTFWRNMLPPITGLQIQSEIGQYAARWVLEERNLLLSNCNVTDTT